MSRLCFPVFPVPLVPLYFILSRNVFSKLLQFFSNFFDCLNCPGLPYVFSKIGVLHQSRVQKLKSVLFYIRHSLFVLLSQLQVHEALVLKMDLYVIEKGCIFKNSLTCHYTVNTCELQAVMEILDGSNSPVCEDRDFDSLLYLLDNFPVCRADEVLFVLLYSSMDGQN